MSNITHTQLQHILDNTEPLFHVSVKQAERHGLEEIRISLSRAKEILRALRIAKKTLDVPSTLSKPESYRIPQWGR
jgi:hypothetical protein